MRSEIIPADGGLRLRPAGPGGRFVIERDDAVVGTLELRGTGQGAGEITFWTHPAARRSGVATGALRAFTEWAHRQGLERLDLVTGVENTPAQRVALAAGFLREGIRRGGASNGASREDQVVWGRLVGDPPGPTQRALPDLPGGELTDGVAILRPLGPEHIDADFALSNLPDVAQWSVPPGTRTRRDIERRCTHAASEWLAGNRADFAIIDADTGGFAGGIGLYNELETGQAMIGYSLVPAFRGKGLATRSVRLVTGWAFDVGIKRLIAGTNPTNVGSQRVLEKAGFVREAVTRSRLPAPDGKRADDVLYALLPGDGTGDS
ncbi:GNAT family N-acetyltransferase [Spirillospora sp. CA-294931]|uniref:GNAT family N-acetyltransferase n=1 Tax=Spirillospora sp. CA-294931 TaxID=3240042 RepID=UPI003D9109A4